MASDEAEKPKAANICPNCFEHVEDRTGKCPSCGFDMGGDAEIGEPDQQSAD